MGLLWERRVGATLYQVRNAGRSLRLYTNGVFHSQYNPDRPVTGSVWDLLLLPAFFYAPGELRRVLVLGVGGGAVIRQLQRFVQPEHITGVELSAVHLSLARRFFGVRGRRVRLEQADAVDWLRDYRGPAFDMIVDDLFGDFDGEPQRAVHADAAWVDSLLACLAPQGMIVSNFTSLPELETSAFRLDPACRARFSAAFQLGTAQNHNAVGVFLTRPATTRRLRSRIQAVPELDPRRRRGLKYRIRALPV
jgi:spermidine synthase